MNQNRKRTRFDDFRGSSNSNSRDNFSGGGFRSDDIFSPRDMGPLGMQRLPNKTPEQLAFDAEFSKWEKSFEEWKRTFASHPDANSYREYERKFLDVRDKLLKKRQQIYSTPVNPMDVLLSAADSLANSILNRFDDPVPSRAGGSRFDSGSSRFDSGSSRFDSGPSRFDSGASRFDSGPSRLDFGTSRMDFGSSRFDSGSSRFDSGSSRFSAAPASLMSMSIPPLGGSGWGGRDSRDMRGGNDRRDDRRGNSSGRRDDRSSSRGQMGRDDRRGGGRDADRRGGGRNDRGRDDARGRAGFGARGKPDFAGRDQPAVSKPSQRQVDKELANKDVYPLNKWSSCSGEERPPLVGKRAKKKNAKILRVIERKRKIAAGEIDPNEKEEEVPKKQHVPNEKPLAERIEKLFEEARKAECPKILPGSGKRRLKNIKAKPESSWTEDEKNFVALATFIQEKRSLYMGKVIEAKKASGEWVERPEKGAAGTSEAYDPACATEEGKEEAMEVAAN